ncbi:MAG: hypothetical protein AAFX06_02645 [Planctomycetota bacterium]
MSRSRFGNHRFFWWMIFLFIPTFALLFFVVTMQRTPHSLGLKRELDGTYLYRATRMSFWGLPYRRKVEIYDLETDRWVSEWYTDKTIRNVVIRNGGTELVTINRDRVISMRPQGERELGSWRPRHSLVAVAGGLVIEVPNRGLCYFDYEEGTVVPYEFDTTVAEWLQGPRSNWRWQIWNSTCLEVASHERVYFRIDGPRLVRMGMSRGRVIDDIASDGSWYIWIKRDASSNMPVRNIVDMETGKVLATVCPPQPIYCQVAGPRLFGICFTERDGKAVLTYQRIDLDTGVRVGQRIELPDAVQDNLFDATGEHLYSIDEFGVLQSLEVDSGNFSSEEFDGGVSWWWPLRVVGILPALIWWLVWSLGMRRSERSYQPLIDIGILHAVLLACFGVRLYAFMNGPDWDGDLHQWESVGFLGAAASLVGWVMLWVVHGPQGLGIRLGAVAFSLTSLAGFATLVWEIDPLQYDPSLSRMRTMIGTAASGASLLSVLWILSAFGIRLCHRHDSQSRADRRGSGFSIQHMIGWTVAFALLFFLFQLRRVEFPGGEGLLRLAASGTASGLGTAVLLWLGLGRTLWRFLFVAIGLGIAGGLYWLTRSYNVIQVSAALAPLVLVSTFVFRWNGYCLRRPIVTEEAGE